MEVFFPEPPDAGMPVAFRTGTDQGKRLKSRTLPRLLLSVEVAPCSWALGCHLEIAKNDLHIVSLPRALRAVHRRPQLTCPAAPI
jgi:hypothetical protein